MRKYLVVTLALGLIALASMLYKQGQANALVGFDKETEAQTTEPVLRLYGFFSADSCMPCGEVIGVLNQLPEHFQVIGVVPRGEASWIELLRQQHQIRFPVQSAASFMRYRPLVTPSIIGASRGGKILFVLPCVTLRPDDIKTFLMNFHMRLAPYLASESF